MVYGGLRDAPDMHAIASTSDSVRRSAPYHRPYHVNERLAQWRNEEPRIPFIHLHALRAVFERHATEDGLTLAECIATNPRERIRRATSELGHYIRSYCPSLPASHAKKLHKKYGERWVQIWAYLAGDRDSLEPLLRLGFAFPTTETIKQLRVMYTMFDHAFEVICALPDRERPPVFRHKANVPFLDAVIMQLLMQISPSVACSLAWYFRQLATSPCRLTSEARIREVILRMREMDTMNMYHFVYFPLLKKEDIA